MELAQQLEAWMPHGMCYLWEPKLLWTHVLGDGGVALAYFAIPPGLLLLARQTRSSLRERGIAEDRFPFLKLLYMFAAFIIACGITHVFGVVTVWEPVYWMSGTAKVATAAISLATAAALPVMSPRVSQLFVSYLEVDEKRRELARANLELTQAREEREQAIRTMAGWLAHDLNNRLQAIQGSAELAFLDGDQADLDELRSEIKQAAETIGNLESISKMRGVVPTEAVDLTAMVRALVAEIDDGGRIEVELPEELTVRAHAQGLEVVIRELLRNAVEAVGPEGPIVVRGESHEDDPFGAAWLSVTNPVHEVPQRVREALFDPFVTTKPGRPGLGLSRAHQTVMAMGALLGARFTEEGIAVRISFPAPSDSDAT